VWLEGLGKLKKKTMTSSGIKPAIFRLRYCVTPRQTGRLTVGRNIRVTLTLTLLEAVKQSKHSDEENSEGS
jgi:hypothetical protein